MNHRDRVGSILQFAALIAAVLAACFFQKELKSAEKSLAITDSVYSETIGEHEKAVITIDSLETELSKCKSKEDLTIDNVEKYIKWLNIKYPDIVLAMVKLESGNLKSNLTKSNNNLLGMKNPGNRVNVSLGSRNGHAFYTDWKMSLIDMALWQARYVNPKKLTREEFLKYLQENYAKDAHYIEELKKLL